MKKAWNVPGTSTHAASTLANEAEFLHQDVGILAVGDEDLITLPDIAHGSEDHHLPCVVPAVLCRALGMASMVEVGADGEDNLALLGPEAISQCVSFWEPKIVCMRLTDLFALHRCCIGSSVFLS